MTTKLLAKSYKLKRRIEHRLRSIDWDFFTTEVWTERGLVTQYVLFVIHHSTRTIHFAGVTTNPDSAFMAQVDASSLTTSTASFVASAT